MLTPVVKRQKRTKGAVPDGEEVRPRQVFENQRRQRRLEYKGIHLIGKDFIHKTNAPEEKADRHHEEDGDCGVEAENQMFQGEAPPFLDFDRR